MCKKFLAATAACAAIAAAAAPGDIETLYGGVGDGLPATTLRIDPYAIAAGPGGSIYFTTDFGYRVQKVSGGVLSTVAGNSFVGGGGENLPGPSVSVGRTRGIAVDAAGNVYFADVDNWKVRRVAPDGTMATVAGGGAAGCFQDGGSALDAALPYPDGIALAADGALYVNSGTCIRKIQGGVVTSFASPSGGATSIAVDSQGIVYAYVRPNGAAPTVQRRNADGAWATVAGGGSGRGTGIAATTANLDGQVTIGVDPGDRLLILGYTAAAVRIETDGTLQPVTSGVFVGAIAFADDGSFVILDKTFAGLPRIVRVAAGASTVVAGVTPPWSSGCPADGSVAASMSFVYLAPMPMAFDAQGRLYTGVNCVFRVEADGTTHRIVAPGATLGGVVSSTNWESAPRLGALAFDPGGRLHMAFDGGIPYAGGVYRLDDDGVVRLVVGGSGSKGDGGPVSSAGVSQVSQILFDGAGTMYLADWTAGRVRKVNAQGTIVTVAGGGSGTSFPTLGPNAANLGGNAMSIALDSQGRLLIASNVGLLRLAATGLLERVATSTRIDDVAIDADDNVYFSDSHNNVVRVMDPAGNVRVIAGTGVQGHSGDGGPAVAATLSIPSRLRLDPSRGLLVGEWTGATGAIRRISLQDRVPDPFSFPAQENVNPSATTTSATVMPSGYDSATDIAVTGGEYSIGCAGSFATAAGQLLPGQSICVRHTSAAEPNRTVMTTLTVGTRQAVFRSTTAPGAGAFTLSVPALSLGGFSMNMSSPGRTVTVQNTGNVGITINDVRASSTEFTIAHDCATLAPQAACTMQIYFTPTAEGVRNAILSVQATPGTLAIPLDGIGEANFIRHYYLRILGRDADPQGLQFWQGETARMKSLGADPAEAAFAMATAFLTSPEFISRATSNLQFVTELYLAFFDRSVADAAGLTYWTGQLDQGLPREVVLASFMFSTEFRVLANETFGLTAARAETDMLTDLYRGLLGRLPDNDGYAYWLQRLRAAQCQSQSQSAVKNVVSDISQQFIASAEYAARNRSDAQFVGDLYMSLLRRGGDKAGVDYWIGRLASGQSTRSVVLHSFVWDTAEGSAMFQRISQQGCLP